MKRSGAVSTHQTPSFGVAVAWIVQVQLVPSFWGSPEQHFRSAGPRDFLPKLEVNFGGGNSTAAAESAQIG